jgi:hypothetical protein
MNPDETVKATPVVSRYEMLGLAPTGRRVRPSAEKHGDALFSYLRAMVRGSGDDAPGEGGWRFVPAEEWDSSGQVPPPEGWGIISAEFTTTDATDFDVEVEPDTIDELEEEETLDEIATEDDPISEPAPDADDEHVLPNPLGRQVGDRGECSICREEFVLARPQRPLTITAEWARISPRIFPDGGGMGALDPRIGIGSHVVSTEFGPGRVVELQPKGDEYLVKVEADAGALFDFADWSGHVHYLGPALPAVPAGA